MREGLLNQMKTHKGHWKKFVKHPEKGIFLVVRALHVNMVEQDNMYCNVRGIWVPFHINRINEMLECPKGENVEYLKLLKTHQLS